MNLKVKIICEYNIGFTHYLMIAKYTSLKLRLGAWMKVSWY